MPTAVPATEDMEPLGGDRPADLPGCGSPETSVHRSFHQLCESFGVEVLYAFGSRAGEIRAWLEGKIPALNPGPSDVDIGVKPAQGIRLSVHDKVRLAIAQEDLFGVHRVDLVSLDDAAPFLAAEIIRGERLYARNEDDADEYDLYVLRRAGDLAPLERERIALILGELSRRVVADRLAWVERMVAEIRSLPLTDRDAFSSTFTTK